MVDLFYKKSFDQLHWKFPPETKFLFERKGERKMPSICSLPKCQQQVGLSQGSIQRTATQSRSHLKAAGHRLLMLSPLSPGDRRQSQEPNPGVPMSQVSFSVGQLSTSQIPYLHLTYCLLFVVLYFPLSI